MPIVIDASVTIAWFVEDEGNSNSDAIAKRVRDESAIVPALWRWEIANAFVVAERRKRIDRARVGEALLELTALPISIDQPGERANFGAELDLARRFGLSAHDAAYLELSLRRGAPFATHDDRLRAAAKKLGIVTL